MKIVRRLVGLILPEYKVYICHCVRPMKMLASPGTTVSGYSDSCFVCGGVIHE